MGRGRKTAERRTFHKFARMGSPHALAPLHGMVRLSVRRARHRRAGASPATVKVATCRRSAARVPNAQRLFRADTVTEDKSQRRNPEARSEKWGGPISLGEAQPPRSTYTEKGGPKDLCGCGRIRRVDCSVPDLRSAGDTTAHVRSPTVLPTE